MATRKSFYDNESPWADTGLYRLGLDVMDHKPIPRFAEDRLYEIEPPYHLRPDLLAYHLYGSEKLWWVFAARNPSALKDPLFHFVSGNKIFLPQKETLKAALGI
jgi:hypothetical protein